MSEIRDRAKEQIHSVLWALLAASKIADKFGEPNLDDYVDEMLLIDDLAVIDPDAELPENPYYPYSEYLLNCGYSRAQQDMRNAGWVKEVKDEV